MKNPVQSALSNRQQYTLIALLTLTALPHLFNIEQGILIFFLLLTLYRALAVSHPRLFPGRLLLFLLTMAGLGNVLLHYPILFGRGAGVALLISMLSLKLVEMRVQRDVHILIFIGYFMLITQFLYSDAGWLVLYALMLVSLLTALLISSHQIRSSHPVQPLALSGIMLLQAVPVTIALFVFFPRFSSPLWNLGTESNRALTGISGDISPGSISRLSRSSAIAFRVDFNTEPPANAKRYWRGPVFWQTDGFGWSAETDPDEASGVESAALIQHSAPLSYDITLEPSSERWLYALELPIEIPPHSQLLADYQLVRNSAPTRRLRYQVTSVIDYRTGELTQAERARGLQLPPNITPRMRDLVERWREQSRTDSEVVLRGLEHFRQQAYFYTLYPPELLENPADQFLFESRRGFCEHYATSFTLLMRIAGIPARVVGGYQGGELNPLGDYLIVRQSDAHAWVEVWLPQWGWRRVDPTAAVAPERIERSLDPQRISSEIGAPIFFSDLDSDVVDLMLRQLRWGADALNASWHRWVLGYSRERQHYLMRLLGLDFLRGPTLAYGMIAAAATGVLAVAAIMLMRRRERTDPLQRLYQEFCRRLQQRRGIVRAPHEGPKDFADRVNRQHPDLRTAVSAIVTLYIGIRYGHQESPENRRRFKRLVRSFRP